MRTNSRGVVIALLCGLSLFAAPRPVAAQVNFQIDQVQEPSPEPAEPPPIESRELMLMSLDGGVPERISPPEIVILGSPDWSPNGQQIAFDGWGRGEDVNNARVAIYNLATKKTSLLTNGAMPTWSPDGKQIAVHTYGGAGAIEVWDLDGEGREVVAEHWGCPRWASSGEWIATLRNGRLSALDIRTGKERYLSSGQHSLRHGFSISPDEKQIACGLYDSAKLLIATAGGEHELWTETLLPMPSQCWHSSWSPQSDRLIVCIGDPASGKLQLYFVDPTGKKPIERVPGQAEDRNNEDCDWSPDGKTIVYASRE